MNKTEILQEEYKKTIFKIDKLKNRASEIEKELKSKLLTEFISSKLLNRVLWKVSKDWHSESITLYAKKNQEYENALQKIVKALNWEYYNEHAQITSEVAIHIDDGELSIIIPKNDHGIKFIIEQEIHIQAKSVEEIISYLTAQVKDIGKGNEYYKSFYKSLNSKDLLIKENKDEVRK